MDHGPARHCDQPYAAGWLGAFLVLFIIIFGAYVLPTVLIGIVCISFDEATRRAENIQASPLCGVFEIYVGSCLCVCEALNEPFAPTACLCPC